ncbi:hypothetical protein HY468_03085 [Candidatus Roizmanbacteria bacterium]|nr:hypothetical protein [Candidatus Roizmanbacteria bacterium]
MIKQHQRFHVLLDEGLYPRNKLPQTNNRHNIRHITLDFKYGGYSIDKKLCSLLNKSKQGDLYGKVVAITKETGKK